jgi:hypothetical protein
MAASSLGWRCRHVGRYNDPINHFMLRNPIASTERIRGAVDQASDCLCNVLAGS